ncbi:MFS transporter [Streptomyces sp. NPDC056361]|uniref:MFS transporter n=1 Tax=Streptomyces sp. NPDC056361 TaxID=3345795 RepID=UPI0035DBEDFE
MAPTETPPAKPGRRARLRLLSAGYRELLAVPGVGRMLVASLVSKLPLAMVTLSLLLYLGPRYSYATGGLAMSCMAVGQGLSAPVRGRLMDRYPFRPILVGCLVLYLVALGTLTVVASARGPAPLVLVLAAVSGVTSPPVGIIMRTLWRVLVDERQLVTAMALDAATSDVVHITSPALAAWLCLSLSGEVAFSFYGALTVVAVLLVLSLPNAPLPTRRRGGGHWAGPLRSAALRRLLVTHAAFSGMITAIDVVISLLNVEQGTTGYIGIQIGALSVGSIVGSLALGAVPGLLARGPKLSVLIGVFAAGVVLLAAASQLSPLAMTLACPVTGLAYGSTFGALFTAGGDLAPEGNAAETQAWMGSLTQAGAALGAWAAAEAGGLTALYVIPVIAVLSAVLTWNIRGPRSDRDLPEPTTT